jgi:hypothetical protein
MVDTLLASLRVAFIGIHLYGPLHSFRELEIWIYFIRAWVIHVD